MAARRLRDPRLGGEKCGKPAGKTSGQFAPLKEKNQRMKARLMTQFTALLIEPFPRTTYDPHNTA
jgi:hypothetical protein